MRPATLEATEAELAKIVHGQALPAVRPNHPHSKQLERFLRLALPRHEAAPIVRHLLTGCPACLKVTRRLWELGERTR